MPIYFKMIYRMGDPAVLHFAGTAMKADHLRAEIASRLRFDDPDDLALMVSYRGADGVVAQRDLTETEVPSGTSVVVKRKLKTSESREWPVMSTRDCVL